LSFSDDHRIHPIYFAAYSERCAGDHYFREIQPMQFSALQILAIVFTYVVFGLLGYRLSRKFKRPVAPVTWIVLVVLSLGAIQIAPGATIIGAGNVGIHFNYAFQAIGVGIIIGLVTREMRLRQAESR
jgi:hypothetical protein